MEPTNCYVSYIYKISYLINTYFLQCNAEAVGPFMEEYFGSVLGPMFENFTMETFNIMDIIDMDIPGYILR